MFHSTSHGSRESVLTFVQGAGMKTLMTLRGLALARNCPTRAAHRSYPLSMFALLTSCGSSHDHGALDAGYGDSSQEGSIEVSDGVGVGDDVDATAGRDASDATSSSDS